MATVISKFNTPLKRGMAVLSIVVLIALLASVFTKTSSESEEVDFPIDSESEEVDFPIDSESEEVVFAIDSQCDGCSNFFGCTEELTRGERSIDAAVGSVFLGVERGNGKATNLQKYAKFENRFAGSGATDERGGVWGGGGVDDYSATSNPFPGVSSNCAFVFGDEDAVSTNYFPNDARVEMGDAQASEGGRKLHLSFGSGSEVTDDDEEARLFRCLDICADMDNCGGVSHRKDRKDGRCWFINQHDIGVDTNLTFDALTDKVSEDGLGQEEYPSHDIYYKYN